MSVEEMIASADVVVFSSSFCPYCRKAIAALNEAGIEHTVIEKTGEIGSQLQALTGKTSVPSGWVKGTYIGGCNDGTESWHGIIPCIQSGKIAELLGSAPAAAPVKATPKEDGACCNLQ
eukprot:TRINITY_DN2064_c0_g1_i3.p1 TRINITY_DN2064_c0_g1~~TRINITY_DN2064_c0_g1_i3.p1  ORF type:complete len:119 (-),score=22.03 TRINITY_DN2064_c0_g1_i3:233-589(-)